MDLDLTQLPTLSLREQEQRSTILSKCLTESILHRLEWELCVQQDIKSWDIWYIGETECTGFKCGSVQDRMGRKASKAFVLTKHSWDMHRTDPKQMPKLNIKVLRMLMMLV